MIYSRITSNESFQGFRTHFFIFVSLIKHFCILLNKAGEQTFISRQKVKLMNQLIENEVDNGNGLGTVKNKMSLEGKNERRAFGLNENLLIK